jgi:hypothetical protein
MNFTKTSTLIGLLFITLISCQSRTLSASSTAQDEKEAAELNSFYGSLKVGDQQKDLQKRLGRARSLECEGNAPGPQRCLVRFRVNSGTDLGAARLGITIKNATVKDEYKILQLDFRGQKLLRWEIQSAMVKRD